MSHTTAEHATRLRTAVTSAGFSSEEESPTSFTFFLGDNTSFSVGVVEGTINLARVMPSGVVSATVTFAGLPLDLVSAAVVAIAQEA